MSSPCKVSCKEGAHEIANLAAADTPPYLASQSSARSLFFDMEEPLKAYSLHAAICRHHGDEKVPKGRTVRSVPLIDPAARAFDRLSPCVSHRAR